MRGIAFDFDVAAPQIQIAQVQSGGNHLIYIQSVFSVGTRRAKLRRLVTSVLILRARVRILSATTRWRSPSAGSSTSKSEYPKIPASGLLIS